MKDCTKNKITQAIEERVQREEKLQKKKRFDDVVLYCKDNMYMVSRVKLQKREMIQYVSSLMDRAQKNFLEKELQNKNILYFSKKQDYQILMMRKCILE